PIYLSVSSLFRESIQGTALIDREIQIHWEIDVDKIKFYLEEPTKSSIPVLQFNTINYPEGFLQTNITLGNPTFPGGWDVNSVDPPVTGDQCLPFWVTAYRKNELVHIECLKIRPTWMQDNRLSIGNLAVTSLFLPGTHNSGCYKRGESLSHRDTAGRYLMAQDQDLWSQLVYGIRYFDLRIGYYPIRKNGTEISDSDNSFWINHDLIKVKLLAPLLKQLKKFILQARDEVVVLDFHRFPVGFSSRRNRHDLLVALLERELKDIAVPYKGVWPTLDRIWGKSQRLIISYGDSTVARDKDWLWPPIKQMWGNQQTLEGLQHFLNITMANMELKENSNQLWAAMAHLTPAPLDILFNPSGSLRTLANSINKNLTGWFKTEWWTTTNIIATDFFLENDLINVAVAANIRKGNKAKKYVID
ncbi:hypothetical protein AAG570_011355, partial [Ranatra chinensis]